MLKTKYLTICICFCFSFLLLFTGCKSKNAGGQGVPFSPFVEAFTSGKVSRYATIYLVLNQEIPSGKMADTELARLIKIKPEVKGVFSFENNKTISFKPAEPLNRNTEYSVSADMSGWFDAKGEDKVFTFKLTTFPLVIRANLETVSINRDHEDSYDIVYTLSTPDRETPETIESLIKLSEKAEIAWIHNASEKTHELTVINIPAAAGSRNLELSVAPNKSGVKEESIITTLVPAGNNFSVYTVRYNKEPERYVEITFTRLLDDSQTLTGLAYMEGNQNETVTIEENKLRLYPDTKRTGMQTIFLSGSIRSRGKQSLGEDIKKEIEITDALPNVRFTGDGSIIPQAKDLNIPFQAVYLRGVIVRVIKVFEDNAGQFLQYNTLDGTNELIRVGRLITRKTIFFDEEETNLSEWRTYALNLNELITPEPGAIYRIELAFNRDLSVYPCDDGNKKTKEQLLAEDDVMLKKETGIFDEGGYYYYYGDVNYDDYEYDKRENPCSNSYYYNKVKGKNVLVTNLGLMAKMGTDDEALFIVHNLTTTYPERAVNVSLYNYQRRLIGSGITDDQGQVKIPLAQGRPYYAIASLDKQRSYMRIDPGSSLSLSTFDVSGEVIRKGIKGFIYGDRGIWRPGDTLFLSFMLNDRNRTLPENHPVTMELFNPLGQSYLRKTQTDGQLGLYSFAMPTESDAPTGAWHVEVQAGGATFSKNVRIESIKPNRLKINLTLPGKPALRDEPLNMPLHAEWLQGAVARNLKYDIQGIFVATKTGFKNYPDFGFDDPAKTFGGEESKLTEGKTNQAGDAVIEARFQAGNSAPGMLLAYLTTRVYEESGDFSIDGSTMLYSPYRRYIGIKPPQTGEAQLVTDKDHTFEVVSVDREGNPSPANLKVEVYKTSWYWWWNSGNEELANYISDSYDLKKKEWDITTDAQGKGSFRLNMPYEDWGTYFIRVKDGNGGHSTGILSYFDWPGYGDLRNRDANSTPATLRFKTDRETYAPGDKMTVTFPSPEGSRAIVSIETGARVLAISEHLCKAGETTLQIDVTPDMQPNAYLHITLLQPYGQTANDLPVRLYGVVPFHVNSPGSRLRPVIDTEEVYKPEENGTITVSEEKGRRMAYTLAIVDEGLLDLTHFSTPDPWKAFNAREALGVSSWDIYRNVLGAYGGKIEQLFSIGGDDALNRGPKAIVNRFKPVVRFEGPFLLKKGEKKTHTCLTPNYNGRVRIMVVAADGLAYGHADKSVPVRKPVMLLGTLPRVIGADEEMAVPATVFATEDQVGNVKVTISCSDNMQIAGSATRELNFVRKEDKQALFRIRVKDRPGTGHVKIIAAGKSGKSVYETDIEIRSVRRPLTGVQSFTLDKGKAWKENVGLPGADGTNSLALEVSNIPPLNLSARLDFLVSYPHGCIEQITSKAFPQLYLKDFASLGGKQAESVDFHVKEAIRRYRSYQLADGSFAYWPGSSSAHAWGSAYAVHFIVEAAAKGYLVPDGMKRGAINYLKNAARNWKPGLAGPCDQSEKQTQAYRLYVLALAQQTELGAMNRLKENQTLNSTARWILAAAYALAGRQDVAGRLVAQTSEKEAPCTPCDDTYGSPFRDKGIRLQTLCLLKKDQEAAVLCREIAGVLSSDARLSTHETACALIGVSSYMARYKAADGMNFSYTYDGKPFDVSTAKNNWWETLFQAGKSAAALEVKNNGAAALFVRVISEGIPLQGEEKAAANGVAISVSYEGRDGGTVNAGSLPQGTNFAAVVTVKNPLSYPLKNLALTEIFPAGWEILNTRFLRESQPPAANAVSYQDIRDDRVYTYIDRLDSGKHVTVRINLTAVYAGNFYLPPVYCEAMYDSLIQANTEGRYVTVE